MVFTGQRKTHTWFYRHSLSIVLGAILVCQTAYAMWAGHYVWLMDEQDHGSGASGWPRDFWIWWSWEYNVSIVADTYGVILIVLLSKWLFEQGSEESKQTG